MLSIIDIFVSVDAGVSEEDALAEVLQLIKDKREASQAKKGCKFIFVTIYCST